MWGSFNLIFLAYRSSYKEKFLVNRSGSFKQVLGFGKYSGPLEKVAGCYSLMERLNYVTQRVQLAKEVSFLPRFLFLASGK